MMTTELDHLRSFRAQDAVGPKPGIVLGNPIAAADELDRGLHDRTLHAGLAGATRVAIAKHQSVPCWVYRRASSSVVNGPPSRRRSSSTTSSITRSSARRSAGSAW